MSFSWLLPAAHSPREHRKPSVAVSPSGALSAAGLKDSSIGSGLSRAPGSLPITSQDRIGLILVRFQPPPPNAPLTPSRDDSARPNLPGHRTRVWTRLCCTPGPCGCPRKAAAVPTVGCPRGGTRQRPGLGRGRCSQGRTCRRWW